MSSRRGNANVVKNRAPAPIQISAEQIVRESADRQDELQLEPVVKVHDREEYQSHLADRRKHYEDNIRYRREDVGNWVKYAKFEEENKELERSRSIYERALEVATRSGELWLRYAEFEMRQEFVNHARNVLDRAVQLLPRVAFLWYKYVFLEEMVGDIPKCRAVFERWMKWKPDDLAWLAFARFETKYGSPERAEQVMRSYVNAFPGVTAFCRFAKWAEFDARNVALARTVLESAVQELDKEELQTEGARLFKQFASMEERQGEYERARVIYQHAIQLLKLQPPPQASRRGKDDKDAEPELLHDDDNDNENEELTKYEKKKRRELYQAYISFEKKHGDRHGIETVIVQKQRAQYQKRMQQEPFDYDGWLEWAALEQDHEQQLLAAGESQQLAAQQQREVVRETYERAVANVPPFANDKDPWRRYIYLWIYYAIYEELTSGDLDRAVLVYKACLSVIPQEHFTFAKIWVYAAKAHVRNHDLPAARKLFGRALGMLTKPKNRKRDKNDDHLLLKSKTIFQEYIALELALGEVDRCRTLYTQYVKTLPHLGQAWMDFAGLEQSVGETERARAIYELALQHQDHIDMPERLWKSFIDFEMAEQEHDKARALYERLLDQTSHVKVWISYAQFEVTTPPMTSGGDEAKDKSGATTGLDRARDILEKAYHQLQQEGLLEERVLLLDAWRVLEKTHGTPDSVVKVEQRMPRRLKRKRMRKDETTGQDLGWEEYFDYQFPDDIDVDAAAASNNARLLEMAAQWKKKQKVMQANDSSDEDSDDDDNDNDGDEEEE